MIDVQTSTMGQKMFINGRWESRQKSIEVYDPQDHSLIDVVPAATAADMEQAIAVGKEGVKQAAAMPSHERAAVLRAAADNVAARKEIFATIIAREGSKTIREARNEVARCLQTLRISAQEATRLNGETIAFDQVPGSENRVGYYDYYPVGLIGAITPFNDPLNLVAHKVGPAIAAGNAIIVKPATATPLSALFLAEAFVDAGLPPFILSAVTGKGSELGDTLVRHPDVGMISFTGGLDTGKAISQKAGLKKIGMELGSNSPVIVLSDARLEEAVEASVSGSFSAAGQNCLGVQRIFIEESIFEAFTKAFVDRTRAYHVGKKLSEVSDMGPMISEKEAIRIGEWVDEAVNQGATVLQGGIRDGAYFMPTVLKHVPVTSKLASEEAFGPVVSLFSVPDLPSAIQEANRVNYGLQAGIFTSDMDHAFQAVNELEAGGVIINDSSDYRIDAMPFGGVKGSGLGREGVRYAMETMSEKRVACFKLGN